jgi:plastocyanin
MTTSLVLMAALMGYDDCWCGGYYAPYGYGYSYSAPVTYGYSYSWGWPRHFGYTAWGYPRQYYHDGWYYTSPYPIDTAPPTYSAPQGETRRVARPDLDGPARIVRMTSQGRFEPAQITIRAGERVEWRNDSSHAHTVTANPQRAANPAHVVLPEGAEPFDSGEVAPGASFSYTFETPGTYIYVCGPHEERGMMGIVVVQEGAGSAAPMHGAPRPQPPAEDDAPAPETSPPPVEGQADGAADERLPPPPPTSSEDY